MTDKDLRFTDWSADNPDFNDPDIKMGFLLYALQDAIAEWIRFERKNHHLTQMQFTHLSEESKRLQDLVNTIKRQGNGL